MRTATLSEYVASQDELVQEAALALPHQFNECTFSKGAIRQAVYLCTTCPEARGICSACSIACHTDHEQLELFPKRNFRCDCPTSGLKHPCQLHKQTEAENTTNRYGQNFLSLFCRCSRPYDAKTERETMIQCIACEDWFHESCCNLRERPPPRNPDEANNNALAANTAGDRDNAEADHDDSASDTSSSSLPPPLLSADDYEAFVCSACVKSIPILKRWAGIHGGIMVIRRTPESAWICMNDTAESLEEEVVDIEDTVDNPAVGTKRLRSDSHDAGPHVKKMRESPKDSKCLAPPVNGFAQQILDSAIDEPQSLGTGDLFLTENFRQRWCKCDSCLPSLQEYPFLLEEEETYEAPEDPESGLSLEELGMRALERIPRDRAIDGIRAFNELRDDLMSYLRPFAQEGKVVTDQDISGFFDTLRETTQKKNT